MEIWKDVEGYDGFYQVSNLGNVRSFKRNKCNIFTQCLNGNGYYSVLFYHNSKAKTQRVHILVAETFLNFKRNGNTLLSVDHINGMKTDNRLENLQIISHRENIVKSVTNKTGFTGVKKCLDKFAAYISVNNKYVHLGVFDTAILAHNKYLEHRSFYK